MLILHVESLSECFFVVCCHVLDDKLLQNENSLLSIARFFGIKKSYKLTPQVTLSV